MYLCHGCYQGAEAASAMKKGRGAKPWPYQYTLISFPAVSLLYDFISEPVKISMIM